MAFDWDTFKTQKASAKSIAVELDSIHRRTGTAKTWYFSTDGFTSGPAESPANTFYHPRVLQGFQMEESLWREGRIGGASSVQYGQIILANWDGGLDEMADYAFDGRACRVKVAETGTALSEYQAQTVCTRRLVVGDSQVNVVVDNGAETLDKPIQKEVYGGREFACWFTNASSSELSNDLTTSGGPLSQIGPMVKGIEAWVMVDDTIQSSTSTFSVVCVSGVNSLGGLSKDVNLEITPDDGSGNCQIDWRFWAHGLSGDGVSSYQQTVTQFTAWRWTHIAVFNDGSCYVDGELQGIVAATSTGSGSENRHTNFYVGRDTVSQNWDGMISEVRLWGNVRTEDEVQDNMNRVLDTDDAIRDGLLVHLQMEEDGGGGTTTDSGPTGYVMTAFNVGFFDGLDGDASLEGKTKPLGYGECLNVTPAMVGVNDQIFQVHGDASLPISSVDAVYDNGVPLTLGTAQTDLYTFLNTAVGASEYDSFLPLGLVKLGTAVAGTVTVDFTGKEDSSGYALVNLKEILSDILTNYASDITQESVSFGNKWRREPYGGIGMYIQYGEGLSVRQAIDRLMIPLQAYWFFNAAGEFEWGIPTLPSTGTYSITLDDDTSSHQKVDSRDPYYLIEQGFNRNYTIQEGDGVAGSVSAKRRAVIGREGRRVTSRREKILTNYPNAQELTPTDDYLLTTRGGAKVEVNRKRKLFGRRADIWQVTVPGLKLFDLKLGQFVELIHDRHGLENGRNFLVTDIARSLTAEGTQVTITVFAPTPRVRYTQGGDRRVVGTNKVRVVT